MSSSICFLGADDRDVLDVVGLELGRDERDDLVDLGLVDPGSLDAHRLARAHRQEECVALPKLLGAGLVEDDAESARRGRERHARGHVGLDEPGDDIDRGALGREDEVDPGRARELRDAHDRLLDVARGDHHQVGELVDDDEKIGVGRHASAPTGQRLHLPGRTALLKSSTCLKPNAARSS